MKTPTLQPRQRKSSILGPDGRHVTYFLYPSPRHNLKQYKPRYWLSPDTKSNVSEFDRTEMVNYSRQLRAQVDVLSTAIRQKNNWAFGDAWDPHYLGRNPKWGQEATEFLNLQFYPMGNVRGPLYDFKRSLALSGAAWDTDGDDAMILTESSAGFPQLAFFPATRIGLRATGSRTKEKDNTVKGGPFDGAKIFDGVIMDRNDRPIGLRITKQDEDPQDISAFSADLAYEPEWNDQGRGIPRIAVSLLKWMNLQDIDEFIQRGLKRASALGLKFKTEGGEAGLGNEILEESLVPQNDPNNPVLPARKIVEEEIEGGECYYLDSTSGEEIEALNYPNPHPNSEAFVERLQRGSLASVGWFYELLDLSSTGRAPSRLLCDLANQSIWERQSSGLRRWKRAIVYAIAKGIKNGFLSPNYDGLDPFMWEPGFPKQLSIDAGNDEAADRDNLKLGTTTKAILAQKRGYHWQELAAQRKAELRSLIAMAREITAETPEITFQQAMELLEQRSPNPGQQNSDPAAAGAQDKTP
jgi:hypothetical protein